jgi:hypothetical protein
VSGERGPSLDSIRTGSYHNISNLGKTKYRSLTPWPPSFNAFLA